MDKFDDPRVAKLPKWVQSIFLSYKLRIRELEAIVNKQEESRVGVLSYSTEGGREYEYIRENATIQFGLLGPFNDGKSGLQFPNTVDIRLEPERNRLQVMGQGCLLVHPHASNVIHITQERI